MHQRHPVLFSAFAALLFGLAARQAHAQCPPNAAPGVVGPAGTIGSALPTFAWTPVAGASSYTLYVIQVSDEAIILRQTEIGGTSFTPSVALPRDVDLRWKVKGESGCGAGPYSPSTVFRVSSVCPPSAGPVSTGPAGNITTATPTFNWSPVAGADTYTLYVLRLSDEATLLRQVGITGTSFTATTPLPTGVAMRWKVKGESSCGPGPYSPDLQFTVTPACQAPAAPTALAPAGTVPTATPTFSWAGAARASSYTLQVTRASDGAVVLSAPGLTALTFTPTSALPAGIDLRWRVRGDNSCGAGPFSGQLAFRVQPPCTLPATPTTRTPSGNVPGRTVTFTWDAAAAATTYSLEVVRVDNGQVLLQRSGLTGTSFAPTTALPLDVDLRWRLRGDNTCGAGPFSTPRPFRLAPAEVAGDTDGDGTADQVNAVGGAVQIFHPALGTTSSYPLPNVQFVISRVIGTDGQRGDEVVISYAGSPGVNGITIIHDATGRVSNYAINANFQITQIIDTDGNPGAEVVYLWAGVAGVNGLNVLHDATGATARYQQNRNFQISFLSDTDGQPGAEIVLIWAGQPGFNGIQVIRDRTHVQADYTQNRQFQLSSVTDTDGQPGGDIIVLWAGAPGFNGIDIIHDNRGATSPYVINANYQVNATRDFDGIAGAEVCYSYFQAGQTRFSLILDRTGQVQSRANCQ